MQDYAEENAKQESEAHVLSHSRRLNVTTQVMENQSRRGNESQP